MNKKTYLAPDFQEVRITLTQMVCASTKEVKSGDGNAGLNYGGGGSGPARSNERQNDAEWGNLW